MPAAGLTLEEVGYPPDDQLGSRVIESRRLRSLDE
jgi:tRNA pseudouridine38-40 synthase